MAIFIFKSSIYIGMALELRRNSTNGSYPLALFCNCSNFWAFCWTRISWLWTCWRSASIWSSFSFVCFVTSVICWFTSVILSEILRELASACSVAFFWRSASSCLRTWIDWVWVAFISSRCFSHSSSSAFNLGSSAFFFIRSSSCSFKRKFSWPSSINWFWKTENSSSVII